MKVSKRLFDLVWSSFGLVVLWPLFCAIGLLIKLDDGGPVFFTQERVGYLGRPFRMLKFRTMVVQAPNLGGALTVGRDPRITRIGEWLRRFKLDELPQLINVFRGEMSLVGPRPEVAKYVALYRPEHRQVLSLVPGITDVASIRFRNESAVLAAAEDPERSYVEEIMPEKIRLNLEYASVATLATDLIVVLKTLLRLFW